MNETVLSIVFEKTDRISGNIERNIRVKKFNVEKIPTIDILKFIDELRGQFKDFKFISWTIYHV